MTHNKLLRCSCNIGTAAHLLFTKAPSSDFQEWFGKVLYPIEFLQVHLIVILIWNEWLGWIQAIWVLNSKTLLLSFHYCIFPHPSPIIWLLCSCHLLCLDFSLLFQSNDLLTPLRVAYCWVIVRTTCYQDLPLVTFWVKYWRIFFSTRGCLLLWLLLTPPFFLTESTGYRLKYILKAIYFHLFRHLIGRTLIFW